MVEHVSLPVGFLPESGSKLRMDETPFSSRGRRSLAVAVTRAFVAKRGLFHNGGLMPRTTARALGTRLRVQKSSASRRSLDSFAFKSPRLGPRSTIARGLRIGNLEDVSLSTRRDVAVQPSAWKASAFLCGARVLRCATITTNCPPVKTTSCSGASNQDTLVQAASDANAGARIPHAHRRPPSITRRHTKNEWCADPDLTRIFWENG